MGDLDFDELDRAVNSLMGDAAVTKNDAQRSNQPGTPTTEEKDTAEPVLTLQDQSTPEPSPVTTPAEPASTEPEQSKRTEQTESVATSRDASEQVSRPQGPSRSVSPAARRGQYMDVVHPSSDMQTDAVRAPRSRVSRQGVSITPSREEKSENAFAAFDNSPSRPNLSSDSSDESPRQALSEVKTVDSIISQPQNSGDTMPDPIDMANQFEAKKPVSDTSSDSDVLVVDADSLPTENESAKNLMQDPTESPFLRDTKVEKRPLGTSSEENKDDALKSDSEQPNDSDITSEPEDIAKLKTPLPAELDSEIMKIESRPSTTLNRSQPVAPAPKPVSKPLAQPQTITSLPQKPITPHSTEDEDREISMYDSADAPLKAPAKKKSSWLIVAGAVALIVLGVLGGVVFFLMNNG